MAEEERAYVREEAGSRGRESALKVNLAYRLCYSPRDIPSASRSRERERARARERERARERARVRESACIGRPTTRRGGGSPLC